jgi:hypothetical protein
MMEKISKHTHKDNNGLLVLDNLPSGGSMTAIVVSVSSTEGSGDGCIHAEIECLATIEKADRFSGWIDPLETLVSRFDDGYQKGTFSGSIIELNGTELGHFDDGSETDSSIWMHWREGQMALDLEDKHLMFGVSSISAEQEWCVG